MEKYKIALKNIIETWVDYKDFSIYLCGTVCRLNCKNCFHNDLKNSQKIIYIEPKKLVDQYLNKDVYSSIIFSGLNWLDQFEDLIHLIGEIRIQTNKLIVIYTGYTEQECEDKIKLLSNHSNIIVKFGEYIEDLPTRYDSLLGITLGSDNQYSKKIY